MLVNKERTLSFHIWIGHFFFYCTHDVTLPPHSEDRHLRSQNVTLEMDLVLMFTVTLGL